MVITRYGFLKGFVFFVIAFFCLRFFSLQVIHHDEYVAQANSVRVKQYELLAKRGEIYMKSGSSDIVPLVMNERTWTIFVDPSYVRDKDKVQSTLTDVLGDQFIQDWDYVWSDLTKMYIEVAKNVNYETVSKIKKANLQGVGQKETSRRLYPRGSMAAQVVGFINAENVGTGLEGSQNSVLSGENGLLKTVTDVNDIPLSLGDENVEIPAKDGDSLVLTLDENIQRKTEKVLANTFANYGGEIKSLNAVIMNPQNGEVYSMASYPTFNPQEYYKVEDGSVFRNVPTDSPYEAASIIKTFTYATAVDQGVIQPTDSYYNYGYVDIEDIQIRNANNSMANLGYLTFQQALNLSYNTGSVEVLRRIGGGSINDQARNTFYNYLTNNFGFANYTGIGLYEDPGLVYSPDDIEGNAVRYSNMSFGQGLTTNMVQVLTAFNSVVNGGDYYKPRIIAGTYTNGVLNESEENTVDHRSVSESTSATMRDMLAGVRASYVSYHDPDGYKVGIKTGTGETLDENGKYTSDKTIVGTIGYGMSTKEGSLPEYTILIRIDGNTTLWGSEAVAVFSELSDYMIEYLRIEPGE